MRCIQSYLNADQFQDAQTSFNLIVQTWIKSDNNPGSDRIEFKQHLFIAIQEKKRTRYDAVLEHWLERDAKYSWGIQQREGKKISLPEDICIATSSGQDAGSYEERRIGYAKRTNKV